MVYELFWTETYEYCSIPEKVMERSPDAHYFSGMEGSMYEYIDLLKNPPLLGDFVKIFKSRYMFSVITGKTSRCYPSPAKSCAE
jgi:hypothetical protein